jgi:glucose/arabinose dehydrogenase
MSKRRTEPFLDFGWLALAFGFALTASHANAQTYRLERIASGLNQPTYVTQAPNDPANILYFTERTRDANPGPGASNVMGRVWRYDVNTRTRTMVLDLSARGVVLDTGLQTIAFHPDFNNPQSVGYGKMYLSSAQSGTSALNRVEEYNVAIGGPNPTYTATLNRLLLQYPNNTQNNHTVDWIGFDPTASGAMRNYLYISTGDGSFGNDYNGGTSPTGRPSQNPSDIAGKMLRVDVAGADAYPGDSLKNYAIPPSNPLPVYNAANPGSPIAGLGEVYLTGLRNVYRASFDRANGDLWMGDVGEVFAEEVSFLKAGTNVTGPPVDYGWPQREATFDSDVDGAPHTQVNPFTSATSLEPLQQFPHDGGGEAVIGGYVYRGPVAALQGKYFYSDFVTTGNANQIWMLDFDRNTSTANYNGNNGTRTDVSALWQSLVYDPTDPTYAPNSTTASSAGLDHVVSFGEDNAGNLYLVDFGNGAGFNGQYPGPGLGEIFRIVPSAEIRVTVNRITGEINFTNTSTLASDIRGYTLRSSHGAIDPAQLTPITGRLDAPPNGNGTIDPAHAWQVTSAPGDNDEFAEASTGGATTLSPGEQFTLSPADGWIQSIYEDFQLSIVLANGATVPGFVEFTGNGGQPFSRSDLNFNGELDPPDWPLFRMNHLATFSGLSAAESYHLGDLDGDGDNDFADFRLFQADYIAANGEAAFAALLNVPEPATFALTIAIITVASIGFRRRSVSYCAQRPTKTPSPVGGGQGSGTLSVTICTCVIAAAGGTLFATSAQAALRHRYSFNEGATSNASGRTIIDSVAGANGIVRGANSVANATQLILPGGSGTTQAYVDLPNGIISALTDATFEAWYTIDSAQLTSWARIFDFGSTTGGELTGPGGGGEGLDYIMYAPMRGTVIDNQRLEARNNDPLFGPGGSAGTLGAITTIDPEHNQTLDTVQHHVAVVFDADGGDEPNEATITLYIDGLLPAGAANNPAATMVQLRNLNDLNNWLGRSNWTSDANFDGMLNEFRIHNTPLTPSQVDASFDAGPNVVPDFGVVSLEVNSVTGRVTIKNSGSTPTNIDYYRITSTAGALETATWNSLDDQNRDAIGADAGESWDEAELSNSFALTELFLLGASGVSTTSPLELGHAYDPSVLGAGVAGDLQFHFAPQGTSNLSPGAVTYATPGPLAGDYNGNGTVDAADYVVWRKTLGSTTVLNADGDDNGRVDQYDYAVWRFTFGNSAGAGSAAPSNAPEPCGSVLLFSACLWPAWLLRMRDWTFVGVLTSQCCVHSLTAEHRIP